MQVYYSGIGELGLLRSLTSSEIYNIQLSQCASTFILSSLPGLLRVLFVGSMDSLFGAKNEFVTINQYKVHQSLKEFFQRSFDHFD